MLVTRERPGENVTKGTTLVQSSPPWKAGHEREELHWLSLIWMTILGREPQTRNGRISGNRGQGQGQIWYHVWLDWWNIKGKSIKKGSTSLPLAHLLALHFCINIRVNLHMAFSNSQRGLSFAFSQSYKPNPKTSWSKSNSSWCKWNCAGYHKSEWPSKAENHQQKGMIA